MKAGILALVTVLAAVLAASAIAGGNLSSQTVYANAGTKVQAAVATKHTAGPSATASTATASTPAASSAGTLPFTGLDLSFIVGAGVVLVLLGWGLRHVTRKHPAA
jgi:hypothetical protein